MDKRAINKLKKELLTKKSHDIFKNVQAIFDLAYSTGDMDLNFKCREICASKAQQYKNTRPEHAEQYRQLYKKTLLMAAPVDFDSYCQYLEWNRQPNKRFYLPRRKQLKVVAEALQELSEGKLDVLAISMPPGSGKTTIAIFFLTWLAGKYPDKPILTGSHSNSFLRGVYDECLRITSKEGEYLTLQRLNNYEDETYLTIDGSVSSVNSKNTMTIKYRYKLSGGSYGSFVTIGDRAKQTLSLDKNNVYIFNVVITDAFGSKYDKEYELGKGVFPLFIDTVKNSVGINKFPAYDKSLEANGLMVLGNRKAIDLKVGESVEIPIPLSYSSGLVNIGIAGDNLEASRLFYVFRSNMYFGVSKILAEEIFGNASAVPMIVSNGDNAYIFKFTNNYSSTIHIRYGILELC